MVSQDLPQEHYGTGGYTCILLLSLVIVKNEGFLQNE